MPDTEKYDVIIVGAGPAGMFAAEELSNKDISILIIEMGKDITERTCKVTSTIHCTHCDPCGIMCGVGGSGTFSDGTLNLRPDIGGDLVDYTGDIDEAWALVRHVDEVFVKYGAPNNLNEPSGENVELLKRKAASKGAKFIEIVFGLFR